MEESENRCKGKCIRCVEHFAMARHADAFLDELERLDFDLARRLRSGDIADGGWYPMHWYRAAHRGLRQCSGGDYDVARQVGVESLIDELTTGFLRLVAAMATPKGALKRAPGLFSLFIETGNMTVVEHGRQHAVALFERCHGFDRAIWLDVAGSCEGALRVAGARESSVQIERGGGDGQSSATISACWQ